MQNSYSRSYKTSRNSDAKRRKGQYKGQRSKYYHNNDNRQTYNKYKGGNKYYQGQKGSEGRQRNRSPRRFNRQINRKLISNENHKYKNFIKKFKTNKNPPEIISNLLEDVAQYDDLFTFKPQKPVNRHTIKYCPDEAQVYRSNKPYDKNYKNKNYNKYDNRGHNRQRDVPEWFDTKKEPEQIDFFDKKIDKKSVKKKSMDHYGENEGYRNENQNRYFKKQRRNQYDGYNNNYQDDYEDNVHKELDFNDIDKLVAQMDSKGKYSDIDLLYEKKLKSKEVQETEELDLEEFDQELMQEIEQKDTEAILWQDTDIEAIIKESPNLDIFGVDIKKQKVEGQQKEGNPPVEENHKIDNQDHTPSDKQYEQKDFDYLFQQTKDESKQKQSQSESTQQSQQTLSAEEQQKRAFLQKQQQQKQQYMLQMQRQEQARQQQLKQQYFMQLQQQQQQNQQINIFSANNPIAPDAPCWYYIDDENKVQGPFASKEMGKWYGEGYFQNSLRIAFVKADSLQDFRLLNQFLKNPQIFFGKSSQQPNNARQGQNQQQQMNQNRNSLMNKQMRTMTPNQMYQQQMRTTTPNQQQQANMMNSKQYSNYQYQMQLKQQQQMQYQQQQQQQQQYKNAQNQQYYQKQMNQQQGQQFSQYYPSNNQAYQNQNVKRQQG